MKEELMIKTNIKNKTLRLLLDRLEEEYECLLTNSGCIVQTNNGPKWLSVKTIAMMISELDNELKLLVAEPEGKSDYGQLKKELEIVKAERDEAVLISEKRLELLNIFDQTLKEFRSKLPNIGEVGWLNGNL